jgi:mitochondrial import inner membrane translocase subunit TIM17
MGSHGPSQVDHHREPCPHRILDDIGGAFSMGAVGGGIFHAGKSLIWGPKGYKMRTALEVRLSRALPLPSVRSHG